MNDTPPAPDGSAPNPAPGSFQHDFEQAIKSYAQATEADKPDEANAAAWQALMLAAAEGMQNPTPELELSLEASDCESAGDWVGAERAHRKALALYEQGGNPGQTVKPRMNLCRLLRLLGRPEEAWQFALAATAAARAADISTLTAMALENQAFCALDRGEPAEALKAVEEACAVLDPGKLTVHMRARALLDCAQCRLASGDVQGAETDLASSWEMMAPKMSHAVLPGYAVFRASWWETRGKLDLHCGKLSSAHEALLKAIEYRRLLTNPPEESSPYMILALTKGLETLASIEERRGDVQAATNVRAEAKLLRERAQIPAIGTGA